MITGIPGIRTASDHEGRIAPLMLLIAAFPAAWM
jgi:hypothetical protein